MSQAVNDVTTVQRITNLVRAQWNWLKWIVAFGLLTFLGIQYREQFRMLASREIQWSYLAFAFLVCGGSIMLTFFRWYLLVWAQEFPFTVRDAFRMGFIGLVFNYVAPGAAGGDIVKAVMIAREQAKRRTVAVATVLLDRILGVLALFMVGAFAILFQLDLLSHPQIQMIACVLVGGSVAGVIGLAIMLHPRFASSRLLKWLTGLPIVGRPFNDIVLGILLYQQRPVVLVLAVLISIAGHFGMLSAFYLCSQAIQPGAAAPGYWGHLMLIPGAELAGVLIPLPGGVGALEGAIVYVYGLAAEATASGVDRATAEAAGLFTGIAYRVLQVLVAALGSGYYLTARREISQALDETDDVADGLSEPGPQFSSATSQG